MPAGGCTFAENPARDAFTARILWSADVDPAVIVAEARPAGLDGDHFDLARLAQFARVALAVGGYEYLALTDGTQRLRLDIGEGSLRGGPVVLDYRLSGNAALEPKVTTLRRFVRLYRQGVFLARSSPHFSAGARFALALRAYDGLRDGASHRDLAAVLFGADLVKTDWQGGSDSLKSRTRRLAKLATTLAAGGYRALLG